MCCLYIPQCLSDWEEYLKNGLVVIFDCQVYHCVCYLSYLVHIFRIYIYITPIFKFTIPFWKRSLITPSWSFDLIPEPTLYWWSMVSMHSFLFVFLKAKLKIKKIKNHVHVDYKSWISLRCQNCVLPYTTMRCFFVTQLTESKIKFIIYFQEQV